MEYTNGQRVEVNDGAEDWVPATYIGKDWTVFGKPYDAHVVLPLHGSSDGYRIMNDDEIRPILTREERIEALIDDYCVVSGDAGFDPNHWGLSAWNRRATLYAILDAEVPE